MRLFPSMPAAIVTGAVGMPLLICGWKFIETTSHSQLLVLVWAIVALIIPVVLATIDLRDVARRWRDAGFFDPGSAPASREAFRQIYFPSWTRMAAWFVSAVVSLLLLKIVGAFDVDLRWRDSARQPCLEQKRTTDLTANCVIEIDGDRIVVTYIRDEKDMDSAVYIQRSLSPDEQWFWNRIVAAAESNQPVQRGGWPPG